MGFGGKMSKPHLWCPECRKLTVCRSESDDKTSEDDPFGLGFMEGLLGFDTVTKPGSPAKPYRQSKRYPHIHWRLRNRRCQDCSRVFQTAEIEDSYVMELLDLKLAKESLEGEIARLTEALTAIHETAEKALPKGEKPVSSKTKRKTASR